MVNDVRFVTSEEDLASEQRPGLTTQGSGVAEVLLQSKGTEKASDIDIRRGQRVPHSLVWVGLYVLIQLVISNRKV